MDYQGNVPLTMTLSKVTLAAGTTSTLSTTGTTIFAIRGKAFSKAVLANVATPTLDWVTGLAFLPILVNQGSIFMVGFDTGGNLKCIQGTIAALDGALVATAKFLTAPQFGGMGGPTGAGSTNQDFCPIGYIVVKCGSDFVTTTWTFGTNNWAGVTGMSAAFVDVIGWPDRPQVA